MGGSVASITVAAPPEGVQVTPVGRPPTPLAASGQEEPRKKTFLIYAPAQVAKSGNETSVEETLFRMITDGLDEKERW